MTKHVYDAKYGGITVTGGNWRTEVAPTSGQHAASFEYDDKGRVTAVEKLHAVNGSTYNRVKTTTSYNADGSPGWGLPHQVIEDQGSGKINRTTETTEYDRAGRAVVVEDAAGRVFETTYNPRGQVELVQRTDTNPDQDIVEYIYGTSGITNGMPIAITDGISGATQSIGYWDATSAGSNLGRLGQVREIGDDPGFLVSDYYAYYDYNPAGERQFVDSCEAKCNSDCLGNRRSKAAGIQ